MRGGAVNHALGLHAAMTDRAYLTLSERLRSNGLSTLKNSVAASAAQYVATLQQYASQIDPDDVAALVARISRARSTDATVLVAGNGGSAHTASHFATDISKTTLGDKLDGRRLRCFALTDNVGLITAWANDFSYDDVFAEQVRSVGREGDALVLISCSGTSPNIVAAASRAKTMGIDVIALTQSGTTLAEQADLLVEVPGPNAQIMEDLHLAVCHAVTLALQPMFASPTPGMAPGT